MKILYYVLICSTVFAAPVFAQSPSIYSRDGKYLGNLNSNRYDPNSVSNPYGRYGSKYSSDSINNPYGRYGSEYSSDSANNPYGKGVRIRGNDNENDND